MFKETCEKLGLTKENIRAFLSVDDPSIWVQAFFFAAILFIPTLFILNGLVKTEPATNPLQPILIAVAGLSFLTVLVRWIGFITYGRIVTFFEFIWSEIPETNRKKKKRGELEIPEFEANDGEELSEFEFLDTNRRHLTLD